MLFLFLLFVFLIALFIHIFVLRPDPCKKESFWDQDGFSDDSDEFTE
jgi:hypothetical protein